MIELLNSKKMIIIVIALVLMCLLIVILEGILTENDLKPSPQRYDQIDKSLIKLMNDSDQYCWMFENYSIQEDCVPCSDFEKAIKKPSACIKSGYKQLIDCEKTGEVYITCFSANSHHFWLFTLFNIILFFAGSFCAKVRSGQLELKMADKLKRQLEAGV